MESKDNKDIEDDNLEVLVDLPITDTEIFANIFSFGTIKPVKRPVKMTMREYKDMKSFAGLCLTATIIIGGICFYQTISKEVEERGSLRNVYNYQIENLEKVPPKGIYP